VSTTEGFIVLGLVLTIGMVLSRRAQPGYIDFLTPMLGVYWLHSFTRGLFLVYGPEWLSLNPQVAAAGDQEIAEAILLSAAGVGALIAAYLAVTHFTRSAEPAAEQLVLPSPNFASSLVAVGLVCRVTLRLANENFISLPDWAVTPVETFGWAALAGIFVSAVHWGRNTATWTQNRGAVALAALYVLIDGRLASSREAVLRPILAVLVGVMIGKGAGPRKIVVTATIVVVPIFLWIGAMKAYQEYDLGPGSGYIESVSAVQEVGGLDWLQFTVGSIQNRFHGLDSLIVCRAVVPSRRPFEEGSVWSRVLLSAFVPRVLYREKQVGWGWRFAVEFWGAKLEDEGRYAIGISHLGEFYVHGGDVGCLTGMAVLGAGLAMLAYHLRRRTDAFGVMMFALLALELCQVDRDLELGLGIALKLLAIFWALMFLRRARPGARGAPHRSPIPRVA